MSTADIQRTKTGLIAWIEQLSDTGMLSFLESLKDSKTNSDWWDELSVEQIKHLNEGLEDAENGRIFSSEDFWKKIKDV